MLATQAMIQPRSQGLFVVDNGDPGNEVGYGIPGFHLTSMAAMLVYRTIAKTSYRNLAVTNINVILQLFCTKLGLSFTLVERVHLISSMHQKCKVLCLSLNCPILTLSPWLMKSVNFVSNELINL